MSEFSGHWTTDAATPEGHQVASYTQAHNSTIQRILAACNGFEGVAAAYLNALAGTVTGANTVAINTGAAIVDGKAYENNASLNVNIPSSVGGSTRIDRIVLRCSWADFTVVVHRIPGTDSGSPSAPAITQTPGTTYDIMLYQALVNSSGTVTLTDERVMAQVQTADIKDANVTLAKMAAESVDDTKIANRVPTLANRQGGSATDWNTPGSTNYNPSKTIMQLGNITPVSNNQAVTFPVPFSYKPVVFLQANQDVPVDVPIISSLSATGFVMYITQGIDSLFPNVFWLAIGPIA